MYGLKRQKCHQNIGLMKISDLIMNVWRLKPIREEQKIIAESGLVGIQ
jgi:hypothetical protein